MKLPKILTQNRPNYMKLPKILPEISTPWTNRGGGGGGGGGGSAPPAPHLLRLCFQPWLQLLLPISEGRNSLKTHIYSWKFCKTTPQSNKSLKPHQLAYSPTQVTQTLLQSTQKILILQEAWKTHCLKQQPTGGNLITDPTKPLPGFLATSQKQMLTESGPDSIFAKYIYIFTTYCFFLINWS